MARLIPMTSCKWVELLNIRPYIVIHCNTLIKVGCLRMSTIETIKEKLPSLEGVSDLRRTRFGARNLETPCGFR